jgi:flagellar biosynthesis/type III secretory pathway protein FliH
MDTKEYIEQKKKEFKKQIMGVIGYDLNFFSAYGKILTDWLEQSLTEAEQKGFDRGLEECGNTCKYENGFSDGYNQGRESMRKDAVEVCEEKTDTKLDWIDEVKTMSCTPKHYFIKGAGYMRDSIKQQITEIE